MDDKDSIDLRQAEEMQPCAVIQETQNGLKDIHDRTKSRTSHFISLLKAKSGLLLLDPTAAIGALNSSDIKRCKLLGEIDAFEAMTSKQCDALRTAVDRYWELDTGITATTATTPAATGKKATVEDEGEDKGQEKAASSAKLKGTPHTLTSESNTPVIPSKVDKPNTFIDEQKVTKANISNGQASQIDDSGPQKSATQLTENVLELQKTRNVVSDEDGLAAEHRKVWHLTTEKQPGFHDENRHLSDGNLEQPRKVIRFVKKWNESVQNKLSPQKKQSLTDSDEPFGVSDEVNDSVADLSLDDVDKVCATPSDWSSDWTNFTPFFGDSGDEDMKKDIHIPKSLKEPNMQSSTTATRQSKAIPLLAKPKPVVSENVKSAFSPVPRFQFPKRTSSMPLNPPLYNRNKQAIERPRESNLVNAEYNLASGTSGFQRRSQDNHHPTSTFSGFGDHNNSIDPSRPAAMPHVLTFDSNLFYRERALPLPYGPGPEPNKYHCVRPDYSFDLLPSSATFSDTQARLGVISSHLPPGYPLKLKAQRQKEIYSKITGGNIKGDTGAEPQQSAVQDYRPFRSLNDPAWNTANSTLRHMRSAPDQSKLPTGVSHQHKTAFASGTLPLRPERPKSENKSNNEANAFERPVQRQVMRSQKIPLQAVYRNADGEWVSDK
ncbi:hypothetical protein B7494_g3536 [Chlorociboria aeruginascens]|nr:hypothetical protein B7494_g3536 [Chlorociboria aeruginascens]